MYQTIVSYSHKLQLGGKSYAPTDDHPFSKFSKELTDFTNFMGKLHNTLEDENDAQKALVKICKSLKVYILGSFRQSTVEKIAANFQNIIEVCQNRWKLLCGESLSTCKRLLLFVDFLSCQSDFDGDIYGTLSGSNYATNTTPITNSKILSIYKTPDLEKVETPVAKDSSPEESMQTPKVKKHNGMSKFCSTLAWAAETSPLILKSSEIKVRTDGTTLVMSEEKEKYSTPKKISAIVAEGLEIANEALKDAKNAPKAPRNLPKRSILKEIRNVEKWTKMEENLKDPGDDITQKEKTKKRKLDITGQENELSLAKKKTTDKKTKKKQQLLKGQMKMTAFLRL